MTIKDRTLNVLAFMLMTLVYIIPFALVLGAGYIVANDLFIGTFIHTLAWAVVIGFLLIALLVVGAS